MKRLKLIWDFFGPDAKRTAEHQMEHLNEFIEREGLKNKLSGVEHFSDNESICYMVVNEDEMISVRDALRPHRGEWYEE
ncbi:MAG: hypothetical protein PHO74_02965 [Weeksellaceae bacterium]|jgi:hypothetical protein|nr:hypothetical protein [Weeksellaceae bacterium]